MARRRRSRAGAPHYSDRRWRRLRARILAERPICEAEGCATPAIDVHHLDELGLAGPRAYDPTNLQALCHACHSRVTAASRPKRARPTERHPGLIDPEELL